MKILVVEESPLARRIIGDELRPAGFEIIEAATPGEALHQLQTVPQIDLLTLRVVLQDMDGFEFLEALRSDKVRDELRPAGNDNVPAVFVTSNDTDADRLRGYQVGAADFIQKPWPRGELLAHINRVLGHTTELTGLSVLVVEDSRTARSFIRSTLGRLGVVIHEADDGETALAFLKRGEQPVDLVITDLHMKQMNGDALCLKIRGELGLVDLPVIFLSGNEDKGTILSLFKMGATDYLQKPFLQEELVARLRAYLEREQMNRSLRGNVERLEELNDLKDEFLAVCSHDLRSPLVGILGFADLLSDTRGLKAEQREMVDGIRASGQHLLELINDLLDLSRLESGSGDLKMVPVDLVEVLESSLRTLSHTATPKGVGVQMDISADRTVIRGNAGGLTRVCNNLLSNAIKFTPAGGQVTAAIRNGRSGELLLEVVDTGIGIPAERIGDLFTRYSKASRTGTSGEKGTGLGLIITKELLEAHGGTISVESRLDAGTKITAQLPLPDAALTAECEPVAASGAAGINIPMPEDPVHAAEVAGVNLRVLLVDDEPVNLKVGKKMLEKMGCEVATSGDGRQALAAWLEALADRPFDIILMDMEMPELDGLESTRLIRRHEAEQLASGAFEDDPVPIVALTANSSDRHLAGCLAAGMNAFLSKPFNAEIIRQALERWVTVAV